MVIRKSSLVFLILGILFVMLYSLVIVSGDISDSRLYFDFYIHIQEKGYFDFLNALKSSSGKAEPAIYFLYALFPSNLNLYFFSFLNFLAILTLFFIIFKFYQKQLDKNFILNSIYFITLLFFWYPIYSNFLWFWRNFIAVELIIISIFAFALLIRIFLVAFGFAFHLSSVLYIPIIFVLSKIVNLLNRFQKYTLTTFLALTGAISGLIVLKFFNLFSFLASGNTDWLETYNGANIVGGLIGIYLFVLILPFATIKNIVDEIYLKRYLFLYSILLFFSSFSLVFLNNHFIIHRVFIFSSMLYLIFYFMFKHYLSKKLRYLVNALLILGCIPTIRSMANYIIG